MLYAVAASENLIKEPPARLGNLFLISFLDTAASHNV